MLVRVVSKGPMDRVRCIDYWGTDADVCRELSK
jgi:hypothetical protein